jgi:hypothetical protein
MRVTTTVLENVMRSRSATIDYSATASDTDRLFWVDFYRSNDRQRRQVQCVRKR